MMTPQNARDTIKNKLQLGQIDISEANVEMVRLETVRIITNSIPRKIRSELNKAVKDGILGHLKKDGLKPEAYFNINAKGIAITKRNEIARNAIECIKGVL